MNFLKWIGIISLVLVSVYLIFLIITFIYLCVNTMKIKSKATSIKSIVIQQYDLICLLKTILYEDNIVIPSELDINLDMHNEDYLCNKTTLELNEIKKSLSIISSKLVILSDNSSLKDHIKYKALKESLIEVSTHYRNETILYNQLLYGHNYWVKFYPFRFIFKILGFHVLKGFEE